MARSRPFGKEMLSKLTGVRVNKLRNARNTFERVLPVLRESVIERKDAVRALERLARFFAQDSQVIEVAMDQFAEAKELVEEAEYDMAHIEMFLSAADLYLAEHLDTVIAVIEKMNKELLKKALSSTTEDTFNDFERAVIEAKQARRLDD